MSREVVKSFESREQSEGVGARVRRTIGTSGLRSFDPFLMLDEFKGKAPAGNKYIKKLNIYLNKKRQ